MCSPDWQIRTSRSTLIKGSNTTRIMAKLQYWSAWRKIDILSFVCLLKKETLYE